MLVRSLHDWVMLPLNAFDLSAPTAAMQSATGNHLSPITLILGFVVYVMVPATAFGLLTGGTMRIASQGVSRVRSILAYVGPILILSGAVLIGLDFVAVQPTILGGQLPAAGFGGGILTAGGLYSVWTSRSKSRYSGLLAGMGFATLIAVLITATQLVVLNTATPATGIRVAFVIPLLSLLPAGYSYERGDTSLGLLTATCGFFIPVFAVFALSPSPPGGNGLLLLILDVLYGLVITIVGIPILTIGAALSPPPTPIHAQSS